MALCVEYVITLMIWTCISSVFSNPKENKVQTVSIPMVDKLNAPLTAELDISKLNKQIRALVKQEVLNEINEAAKNATDKLEQQFSETNLEMKVKVDSLEKQLEGYEKSFKQFQLELNNTGESLAGIVSSTSKIFLERQMSNVSFSARLGASIPNINPDATVIFDQVITNNGGNYSPVTGIFRAPVDGTYYFTSSILTKSPSTVEMVLRVNGISKMLMYTGAKNVSYNNAVNSVIVQLRAADEVKIAKSGIYGSRPFYIHGGWSTFSGFLISPSL